MGRIFIIMLALPLTTLIARIATVATVRELVPRIKYGYFFFVSFKFGDGNEKGRRDEWQIIDFRHGLVSGLE